MTFDFPVVMAASGPQPQAPATVLQQLLANVSASNPGYTYNLPGSLVEDISSTDTFAILLCDQARVELINSLTPYGANEFILGQLGQVYGVQQGAAANAAVELVFTGPAGYVIPQGLVVSDGVYFYTLTSGGVIQGTGVSDLLSALATQAGAWAILPNSVTNIITSIPTGISITVTNPSAGTPGGSAEDAGSYRARVLQAGLAASQGMASYMKTLLANIPNVQRRLIAVRQRSGVGWEVICGGGDNYAVAYAIFSSVFDISTLVPSVISVTGATNANPGVITTDLNHGYVTGAHVTIAGVNPSGFNGTWTITVLTPTTFSIGASSSGFGTYVSGGTCSPNSRNVTVSIKDYPDTYSVTFVNPPQQAVAITVTWNTTLSSFTGSAAVNQLAAPALISYVNSIPVGAPMNLLELTAAFQTAVVSILPTVYLTRLVFQVSLNGIPFTPSAGTSYIPGDPESYFYASPTSMTIAQG